VDEKNLFLNLGLGVRSGWWEDSIGERVGTSEPNGGWVEK